METTPSITFDTVFKTMVGDRAMVQWKSWNEFNILGQATIIRRPHQLLIECNILDGEGAFSIGVDLDELPESDKGHGWCAICPRCATQSSRLFLVKQKLWCRACHKLLYTSQTLTSAERWGEDYRRLKVEAARERRFGEHFSTFQKRRAAAQKKIAAIEKSPKALDMGRRPAWPIRTFYAVNSAGPWLSA